MINTAAFQGKTAAYFTLGCKLNFSETSTFGRLLADMGVRTADKGERADICIVNTCSVTEVADHKCRQAIHRMVREHPGAFVIVTGCYAQLKPDTVSRIDGVDLVLGADEKAHLVQFLSEAWGEKVAGVSAADNDAANDGSAANATHALHRHHTHATKDITTFAPSCSRGGRTRYFLKVQDGCDYYCTYCTIPFARGRSRNPSIASLVEQASAAAKEGGKEIVLTGVNIGTFGTGQGATLSNPSERFIDLCRALDDVKGISRYRISSIEPNLLTDDLIDFCAESRAFMPHFHIPLQSGSDEVLRLMHRRYDTALFASKIDRIRRRMPNAFIGVDVMVGTRGETEALFEQTYQFLNALDITQLHVFPYSERPGTAALRIPHTVSDDEKRQRSKRLLALSDQKTWAFYERHIGHRATVLLERAASGKAMHGFTPNYLRIELPPSPSNDALDNQLLDVTLGPFNHNKTALKATLI